ncbi:MAG: septum formation initiator family protein [Oscillospiraceae bacterium]|nr:septum formation initiator family protein [Oscillospiraceae bacterium]
MQNIKKKINLRSVLFLLVIVYLTINLISAQFELMTKKQELANIQAQKDRLQLEVADTQSLLDEDRDEVYIERIARERLGYANPGEKVYIDIQAE